MVVSTRPSSQFYQLSFRQCSLRFFLNQFLRTFRDFADDNYDSFEKDIKSVESSDQSSDSFSSNSELFDEVEFLSEEMYENGCPELSMDECCEYTNIFPFSSLIIYSLNYFPDIFTIYLFKPYYLEVTDIFLHFSR